MQNSDPSFLLICLPSVKNPKEKSICVDMFVSISIKYSVNEIFYDLTSLLNLGGKQKSLLTLNGLTKTNRLLHLQQIL